MLASINTLNLNPKEKDFESALYLTPPRNTIENSPFTTEDDEKDLERLINTDLLQEINRCAYSKPIPFKDITHMTLNSIINTCESMACDHNCKKTFAFPDGGWVCSFCQNYNFFGRVKCNRCDKEKSKDDMEGKPKHLLRFDDENSSSDKSPKKKKILAERAGDWVCAFCKNLNFAFRKQCNRCMKNKDEVCAIIYKAEMA